MKRPARVSILKVDRATCRTRKIPTWEVTFQISSGETDSARTTVQVLGSHGADGDDVVAQAWQVLGRISGVVATAQANFAAAQQATFESAPPVESQLERLERARMTELKRRSGRTGTDAFVDKYGVHKGSPQSQEAAPVVAAKARAMRP